RGNPGRVLHDARPGDQAPLALPRYLRLRAGERLRRLRPGRRRFRQGRLPDLDRPAHLRCPRLPPRPPPSRPPAPPPPSHLPPPEHQPAPRQPASLDSPAPNGLDARSTRYPPPPIVGEGRGEGAVRAADRGAERRSERGLSRFRDVLHGNGGRPSP